MSKSKELSGANLTYYIFEGILVGNAGGKNFHIMASSGGGTGSTKNQPDFGGVFHPYSTGDITVDEKGKSHKHGGALPTGKYIIHKPAKHPHLGLSAYLEPDKSNNMMGRSGFYIHGRGPHGSDGCIVPLSGEFNELMTALKKDGSGVLFVEEAMGGARFA